MTGFDITVILIVIFFGVIGWIRGFSWQLVGVVTIALGFTVAYPLSGTLEPTMANWLGYELTGKEWTVLSDGDQRDVHLLARGAAWAAAFALIWLFTHILYYFFREAIERWHMEELNRTLGAIFGVIKGALVVMAVTLILVILGVERTRTSNRTVRVGVPRVLDRSLMAPTIMRTMRAARFVLPGNFATGIGYYLDALDDLDEETLKCEVQESGVPEAQSKPRSGKSGKSGKAGKAAKKPDDAPPAEAPDSPEQPETPADDPPADAPPGDDE